MNTGKFKIPITIAAILIVMAFMMPLDDNYSDVYVELTIYKPLIGDTQIKDYRVSVEPHTILQVPYMASVLSSGNLKLSLSTDSASNMKSIGSIERTGRGTYTIILPKVPATDQTLTITLYEDNQEVDSRTVLIGS